MSFFDNEEGVSEVVGALLIFLILILYLGILQSYEVPKWNKDLEIQHFDNVYSDFVDLRSNIEDVSLKNTPKTGSIEMGLRYPERFLLQNPGAGAFGTISTFPVYINVSYSKKAGTVLWKNYTSSGIVYEFRGTSDFPKLVYENGLIIKDFGEANISMEENQSLATQDNIFIPVISAVADSGSSMETMTIDIDPFSQAVNNKVRFASMNVSIETRYPEVWEDMVKGSKSFDIKVENSTVCPSHKSSCIMISNIPGYYLRRVVFPENDVSLFDGQIRSGMITIDNSLMGTRGATGPDGQDMWQKNQGRLDIPAAMNATQFLIQDITMGRSKSQEHGEEDEQEEKVGKLKFSVTDTMGHLWTVEIKLRQDTSGSIYIDYVKQKYPKLSGNYPLNVFNGKYNDFTSMNITSTREINLTAYYKQFSNISVPNVLTIDQIDPQILYVNFVIN